MKKSIITIILALCLIQVSNLQAQTESYDAEYLRLVKEYTLNEDGSYDYHYFKEIKLNTYYAFHRLFGETFIVYNPEYQELKINEAFTVMADGKKVVAPANAFNEVLPGFARDIPAYNHLREMVVTHTGTEIGCVITLDYTLKTKQGFQPQGFQPQGFQPQGFQPQGFQPQGFQPQGFQPFFGAEEIGDIVPIKDLTIIINVPQNIELKQRMLNNRTAPAVIESDGQRSYTWTFTDVPALSHAANQDPERKQMLLFTTAKDMTGAYYAFVNQEAFKSTLSPEISRRIDAVVKGKTNDIDIILALQSVVIDEVKYADIPLIYSGYKVRTPSVTWQSANATSLEKAILLSEMLKKSNINACPVATVPNAWYSSDMGNPAVFDGYMVQVNPKETGRIYLSVTQKQFQNLIYDVQDKTMIQLDGAIESMRTFKEKAQVNVMEMEGKMRLGDGETGRQGDGEMGRPGEMEMEIEMSGICNPYYKLRKDSSYVKSMISGDFPASSIKKIEQDQLAELKSRYTLTNDQGPVTNDYNGFIYFELPRFKTGFDAWNLSQFTGSGDTPVRLDFPLTENYEHEIVLPSGYSLFTPPAEINIKNDLGELNISLSQSGQTVKIERSWELYKDVISSDLMDELKEMILAWEKTDYRKIVLKKK